MDIVFTPIRADAVLELAVSGNAIIINGERFNLAKLPAVDDEGAAIPYDWGSFSRSEDGAITATVILPHGPEPTLAQRFPAALTAVPDGPVDLFAIAAAVRRDPAAPKRVPKEHSASVDEYNARFRAGA